MVKYTDYQKKVLRELGLCKVNRRKMYADMGQLGYCSKGGIKYDVNIASDAPEDVTDVVLLHELGHIFYGHVDLVDQKKEFQDIEQLCKDLGRDFKALMYVYNGPHDFLNICMDLQINSTILTHGNIEIMKNFGFGLCTPESFNIDLQDAYNGREKGSFRSYYKPLIEIVPPEDEQNAQDQLDQLNEIIKNLKDAIGNQKGGNGKPGVGPGAGMQDLPSTGNLAFDDDLSEELQDALQDEDYVGGDTKKNRNDKVEDGPGGKHGTVNDYVDANETKNDNAENGKSDDVKPRVPIHGLGTGDTEIEVATVAPDAAIMEFLEAITEVKRQYKHDVLKHYNRGSRVNPDGILYTSTKARRNNEKKKLGILIDVSGSMNSDSLLSAINSIDQANIDDQSIVAAWDTELKAEFLVTDIPDTLQAMGGTDMAAGLKYLVGKDMKHIIIYSDFGTNMTTLIEEAEAAKQQGCTLYSIIAASKGQEQAMKNACEGNVEGLTYFHKYCKKNLVVGTL